MKNVRNEDLVRLSLRTELTPEEESRLESYFDLHPEARGQWEEERALSRAVAALPHVPVSSNFTARVLQEIDLQQHAEEQRKVPKPWLRMLLPRFAWAATAALLAFFGVHEWRAIKQAKMAKDVWFITKDLKRVPDPEILQDFEVINSLRTTPAATDDELLIALQ
jgi:anti-sigma factor RsiW